MRKRFEGFDRTSNQPILAVHYFEVLGDGQIAHIINDKLRATIPPEGWELYAETYPEIESVVAFLRRVPEPAEIIPEVPVIAPEAPAIQSPSEYWDQQEDEITALKAKVAELENLLHNTPQVSDSPDTSQAG